MTPQKAIRILAVILLKVCSDLYRGYGMTAPNFRDELNEIVEWSYSE